MNYANIKYYDIANGPGVRTSVFVSGCRHHCPGCFNAVAWDFAYGQPFDKTVRNEVFASCQPDYIAGLSLLGGEPFEPENQRELLPFVRNFKALYPAKTVWCYSGYTWEQLTGKEPSPARCEVTDELLALLDVALLRAAAAKAGVSDITQKKDALRFTLAVFRPEALVQVCGLTKYKFRLTLSAGETPMLTLKLKPGADVLETALELVEDLKLATQALEKA